MTSHSVSGWLLEEPQKHSGRCRLLIEPQAPQTINSDASRSPRSARRLFTVPLRSCVGARPRWPGGSTANPTCRPPRPPPGSRCEANDPPGSSSGLLASASALWRSRRSFRSKLLTSGTPPGFQKGRAPRLPSTAARRNHTERYDTAPGLSVVGDAVGAYQRDAGDGEALEVRTACETLWNVTFHHNFHRLLSVSDAQPARRRSPRGHRPGLDGWT